MSEWKGDVEGNEGPAQALRQANILIIFGLAWVLTGTFFKTILAFRPLSGWHGTVIAAGFAVLALVYFNHYLWLPTPSYNSLALQSLMIAATGLLLMERNGPRENLTGCMLLGIGGWLAFIAKPTTAIALGCCSVFYLFTVGKLTARLLFMPMAVAAISFVVGAFGAGIFWVLAGFFIVVPAMNHERFKYMVLSLVLAGQMMTVVLVDYAIEHPYRQPQPLRENNYPVDVGRAGSTLILAGNSGRYVSEAMDLGERGSFSHGTPMIDLTGRSPGVLYAMGAKSIGLPWLPGQYPGSDELVTDVLKRVACEELAVAWLLMAPGDPRRLSVEILLIRNIPR